MLKHRFVQIPLAAASRGPPSPFLPGHSAAAGQMQISEMSSPPVNGPSQSQGLGQNSKQGNRFSVANLHSLRGTAPEVTFECLLLLIEGLEAGIQRWRWHA